MELNCDLSAAIGYTNPVQIARVLSEAWFRRNGFCLACECETLEPTANNTKACDFVCRSCSEGYELKTFRRKPATRLIDGACGALVSRLQCGAAPTLVLMERSSGWSISGLPAIHPLFLTPDIVEKRKPLSSTARRAGWIGCNIRLDLMGNDASIEIIKGGVLHPREFVREQFRRFNRLREVPIERRGWTTLTLSVLRTLHRSEFCLAEIYSREHLFSSVYPNNRNIRAKVRQQLQILRDLGYLEFVGRELTGCWSESLTAVKRRGGAVMKEVLCPRCGSDSLLHYTDAYVVRRPAINDEGQLELVAEQTTEYDDNFFVRRLRLSTSGGRTASLRQKRKHKRPRAELVAVLRRAIVAVRSTRMPRT